MQELALLNLDSAPGLSEEPRDQIASRLVGFAGEAYQIAVRVMGTSRCAEDVVQQAYINALRYLRTGRPPEDERTWFLKVAANAAKDHLKLEARRRKREVAVESAQRIIEKPTGETITVLRRAVAELEDKYRLPVALCYEQSLTQRQAAVVLEVPESTLADRLQAGIERLRKVLTASGCAVAPAAVLGSLKQTAPQVPAGLAAAVQKLVASGAGAKALGAAGTVSVAGGLALSWKLASGVLAAGLLGAGVWGAFNWAGRMPVLPAVAPEATTPAKGGLPATQEAIDRRICDLLLDWKAARAPEMKRLLLDAYRRYGGRDYVMSYACLVEPTDADTIAGLIRKGPFPPDPDAGKRRLLPSTQDVKRKELLKLLAALDRRRACKLARELWDGLEERDALAETLARFGSKEDLEWLFRQLKDGHLPGVKRSGAALAYGQELPRKFHVEALVHFASKEFRLRPKRATGSIVRLLRDHRSTPYLKLLQLKAAGVDAKRAEDAFAEARKRMPVLAAGNLRNWAQIGLDEGARKKLVELYPRLRGSRRPVSHDLAGVLAGIWADGTGRKWVDGLAGGGARDKDVLTWTCRKWPLMGRQHVKTLEEVAKRPKPKKGRDWSIGPARRALAGTSLDRAFRLLQAKDSGLNSWNGHEVLAAARTSEDFGRLLAAVTTGDASVRRRAPLLLQCVHPGWFDRHTEFANAGRKYFLKNPARLKACLDNAFPRSSSRMATISGTLSALRRMGLDPVFAGMLRSKDEEDVIRALTYFNQSELVPPVSAADQVRAFEKLSRAGKVRFLSFRPRYHAPAFCATLLKLAAGKARDEVAEAARERLAGYSQMEPACLVQLYRAWLKSENPDLFALGAVCLGRRDRGRDGKGRFPELPKALTARLPELKGRALARAICARAYRDGEAGVKLAENAWPGLDVRARAELITGMESVRSWTSGRKGLDVGRIGALIVDGLLATDDLAYRRAAISSRSSKILWICLVRDEWGGEKTARAKARAAAALLTVLKDNRDPELQRAVASWVSVAGDIVKTEPKIKATIERLSRTARDEKVRQRMAQALKRLEEKPRGGAPRLGPRPEPQPPEVF